MLINRKTARFTQVSTRLGLSRCILRLLAMCISILLKFNYSVQAHGFKDVFGSDMALCP